MDRLIEKIFVITIFITFLFCDNLDNSYNNKLLFCLKKDAPKIIINRQNSLLKTGLEELDNFIVKNNVQNLELWLPGATDEDHDGEIYLNRIYRVFLSEKSREELSIIKNELEKINQIYSVEFEYKRRPFYSPNDTYFGSATSQQWYLYSINSNDAWDYWTDNGETPGNRQVILASVDTGVNWTHADLRNNLWENLGEDANGNGHTIIYSGGQYILDPGDLNGIDDDDWDNNANTYIDDLIGWDPSGNGGVDDNNPDPPNSGGWSHGSHVAGLLAATTDNSAGIASTAFNCSLMSVKVSDENQSGDIYITDGFAGILYAAKAGYFSEGFTVINNSWGGGGFSQYENSVINTAVNDYNAIVVCAGGNGSTTGWGEAYEAHYPSSYENSVSVCPLGNNNQWNHWGTYHETIDLASPGENIRSCTNPSSYQSWDGSSMASPVVASVFGLVKSQHMDWTNEMIRTMVLATSDPVIYDVNSENYLDGMLGKGRVDAYKAIQTPLFPKIDYAGEDIYILNDSDGNINPGEEIELSVVLVNDPSWGTALNSSGFLVSLNSDVNIVNPNVNFGDINPGEVGINIESPFQIIFDASMDNLNIELYLYFSSNQNDYVEYTTSIPITLTLEEMPIISGDLNQDTVINILDVVQLVNIILGTTDVSSYQNEAGDMNQDNILNIQDIIILINTILQ